MTKKFYGWPEDRGSDGVYDLFKDGIGKRGSDARAVRNSSTNTNQVPELASNSPRWRNAICRRQDRTSTFAADAKGLATREFGQVLNAIAKNVPWIVGAAT